MKLYSAKSHNKPEVLTDHTRLEEIYKLRALAWKNSPSGKEFNLKNHPQIFRDNLEERSIHYISTDKNDMIIGSARLTLCNKIDELPYMDLFLEHEKAIPLQRPFLLYSRLVIHPDFRKKGLSKELDLIRIEKQLQLKTLFGLVMVMPKRLHQIKSYGYKVLGEACETFNSEDPFSSFNAVMLTLDDIITSPGI